MTATAAAGPSGVSGIAARWMGLVSVASTGERSDPCIGLGPMWSRAKAPTTRVTSNGMSRRRHPQSWSLRIRQPTMSVIGFSKLVDPLVCRKCTSCRAAGVRYAALRCPSARATPQGSAEGCCVDDGETTRQAIQGQAVQDRDRGPASSSRPSRCPRAWGTTREITASRLAGPANGAALAGKRVRILAAPDDGLERLRRRTASATTEPDGTGMPASRPGRRGWSRLL